MRIICVDDEELVLNLVVSLCKEIPEVSEVEGFSDAYEALDSIKENKPDAALLDIDMPGMNGIELAVRTKEVSPDTAVIFLTGYSEYALEAFNVHARGYILKPVGKERIAEELSYIKEEKQQVIQKGIFARTFGEFDLFADGKPVVFSRSKAKELMAYLVDRHGASVTRATAFAALYEDKPYDRAMQKQFDVIIRSLKDTLTSYDLEYIFEMKSGSMRIIPEEIDCDLYRLMRGNSEAVNSFRGEYMTSYPWAMMTEAYIHSYLEK
jgi:two-component SAPR family response regulator